MIAFRPSDANPIKFRMCYRKRPYNSRAEADEKIKGIKMTDELHSYQCPYCTWWHIGHPMREKVS